MPVHHTNQMSLYTNQPATGETVCIKFKTHAVRKQQNGLHLKKVPQDANLPDAAGIRARMKVRQSNTPWRPEAAFLSRPQPLTGRAARENWKIKREKPPPYRKSKPDETNGVLKAGTDD